MAKRINIILPDKGVAVLNRANLRARLKAEAIENADRDLRIAADWFPLEAEAWDTFEQHRAQAKTQPRHSKRT